MQIQETCVHIYIKYEVCMSNDVARSILHSYTDADNDDDDRQSMIVQGSLVDKRNEPKKPIYCRDEICWDYVHKSH